MRHPTRRPRKVIHLPAEFTGLTVLTATRGEGYTVDLSATGCRIESDTPMEAGKLLSLRMDLSLDQRHRSPVAIPVGRVRWSRHGMFGVEFVKLAPRDRLRLLEFVNRLVQEEDKKKSGAT